MDMLIRVGGQHTLGRWEGSVSEFAVNMDPVTNTLVLICIPDDHEVNSGPGMHFDLSFMEAPFIT